MISKPKKDEGEIIEKLAKQDKVKKEKVSSLSISSSNFVAMMI
jgi:hypothetical protein